MKIADFSLIFKTSRNTPSYKVYWKAKVALKVYDREARLERKLKWSQYLGSNLNKHCRSHSPTASRKKLSEINRSILFFILALVCYIFGSNHTKVFL